MAEESLFLCYVRYIFKKWVGFQAAIDAGMGGPFAREKEKWLSNEVEKYFKVYVNVAPEDLEEFLSTMLDNEFDTHCEDGSIREISLLFCNAYGLSLSNPGAEIFQPIRNTWQEAEEITPLSSVTKDIAHLTMNEEDDGWTTVSNKHKKPT